MRITWLADVLRAAGLEVVEHAGWRDRARPGAWEPRFLVAHATAAPQSQTDETQVRIVRDGRSDLSGPIANACVDRGGRWHVLSAGRCNTTLAGTAGPFAGQGNSHALGIEACNDNRGEAWSTTQYQAYVTGVAAICRRMGWPESRVVGHREHTPGHKTDPTFGMNAFRALVRERIEGDDMPTAKEFVDELLDRELPFPYDTARPSRTVRDLLRYIPSRDIVADAVDAKLAPRIATVAAAVAALDVVDDADRAAIAAQLLAGLPPDLAKRVVDELTARLAS